MHFILSSELLQLTYYRPTPNFKEVYEFVKEREEALRKERNEGLRIIVDYDKFQ